MIASIIIPTLNRSDQLSRCLESIVNQKFLLNEYEIIVVDNGSHDKTREVVCQYKTDYPNHQISYLFDDTPGLLTGRHLGARKAESDILIFVDDDIHAHNTWLSAIIETFSRYPEVHLVGGKCLPLFESEPPAWLEYFWNHLPDGGKILPELSLCDYGDEEKLISPNMIWGLNYSIRKKSFIELGGFHPDCIAPQLQYFQGDGEAGLSYKAKNLGYKAFYQPKSLVYHEVPKERMTLNYFERRYFYQGICNSYSEIRRKKGLSAISSFRDIKGFIIESLIPVYRFIFPKPDISIQSQNFDKEMLMTRMYAMEKAGYNFHQAAAKKSSDVMKWILKENYWDYSIPAINIDSHSEKL